MSILTIRLSIRTGMRRSIAIVLPLLLLIITSTVAQQREPRYDPDGELHRLEESYQQAEQEMDPDIGESPRGREEWFYFQRRFPYDMIPAGLRTEGIRRTRELQQRITRARAKDGKATLQAASRWEQIGPYNIAGRTRAIAINPTNPEIIYIGAAAGGVWKTTNGGTTWATTFDQQSALAIGALAVDFSNPNIIYAGTGEYTFNIDSYLGNGIFKSTDAGATWANVGLNAVGAFSKIHVHRQNPQIIYATATKSNGGFYRSTDGGGNWTQLSTGSYFDMAVNPQNNDEVYITTSNLVRRSTDGGVNFTNIVSGVNTSGGVRLSVAVVPSNPSNVYLLVVRSPSGSTHIGEVYVSTNSGASWQLKYTFPDNMFNLGGFGGTGWYNNCLAVHPTDPSILLAGGVEVYRSLDGGANWQNTSKSYQGGVVHADQHMLMFDPSIPDIAYVCDDGGVFRSLNGGGTWESVTATMPTSQYYGMRLDQTRQFRVYGGTQDNGTHAAFGTDGYPEKWTSIYGGDGFYVEVDQTDPNRVYVESPRGSSIYRVNVTNSSSITDRARIDLGIPTSSTAAWSAPLVMSRADKTRLYSGRQTLWRTKTSPSTGSPQWEELKPGNSNYISAVGLSPHDATKMMIGTESGELRFSTNDGATWATPAGYERRYVTDIVYDPVTSGRVYVAVSGSGAHVYVSQDNGANLTNISSNLPDIPVNAIAIDPVNNQHIFIGTDAGVFVSMDGGGFWFPFNDGLALAPVVDLDIHASTRMIVAATHGRSMFQASIDNVPTAALIISPSGGETYSSPGKLTVTWAGFSEPVRVLLSFDGGNTYPVGRDNLTGGSVTLDVPFANTTNAVVRVQNMDYSATVMTDAFTFQPAQNALDLGAKGLHSQAIVVRGGHLWLSQRGSDSLVKLRLPSLSPLAKEFVPLSGISGAIRDMAYDMSADIFYVLQTNADYSGAKIYRMDTTGTMQGELTLPVTTISGITVVPQGLALITPGTQGKIYIINPASGAVVRESRTLENARGERRAGLVYDGFGVVQGVSNGGLVEGYPSELQRTKGFDTARTIQFTPVVAPSGGDIEFYDVAFDATTSTYFATDTAGNLYSMMMEGIFLGVQDRGSVTTGSATMAIHSIVPNPLRGATEIEFEVHGRETIRVELYDTHGTRMNELFSGSVDAGTHTVHMDGGELASGVYYVAISNDNGERVIRSVVVMK